MKERALPLPRSAFRHHLPLTTRWMDNDTYGHLNNVVYYSLFDTAVNGYLIASGALDVRRGSTIGYVVETHCHYFAPLSFPQAVVAGLRVIEVGRTSVRYGIGIFAADADSTAAHGEFVHVYVDRVTQRPVPLPDALQRAIESLR